MAYRSPHPSAHPLTNSLHRDEDPGFSFDYIMTGIHACTLPKLRKIRKGYAIFEGSSTVTPKKNVRHGYKVVVYIPLVDRLFDQDRDILVLQKSEIKRADTEIIYEGLRYV